MRLVFRAIISALLVGSIKTKAQEPLYKNIVYVEGFGNNLIGSINYERFFYREESVTTYLRASFYMAPDNSFPNLCTKLVYNPLLMLVTQMGLKRIKFELGIGGGTALGGYTRANNIINGLANSPFNWFITGTLGLRYTGKNGLLLKIGYTPIYFITENAYGFLWGGTSIGYTFREKEKSKPVSPLDKLEALPNNIIRYPIDQYNEEDKPQSIKKGGVVLPNKKIIYPADPINKKPTYPDSTKKTYYSLLLNEPTRRVGYGYGAGIEYYHSITKKIAFASSFTTKIGSLNNIFVNINNSSYGQNHIYPPLLLGVCLQPFHLLIGQKRLRFETGLSVSYINYYLNHPPSYIGSSNRFQGNIYFGVRYNFKRIPFHAHLAYVPYIDPRYFKAPDLEWFNPSGFEFGIGYILHKSQDAKRRDEIRKLNERSY